MIDNTLKHEKDGLMIIVPLLWLGGQERVAVMTADIMMEKYEPKMIIFDGKNALFSPKCQVISINASASNRLVGKVFNVLNRRKKVKSIIKQYRPKYCLSFGNTANLINAISPWHNKVLVSIRGYAGITTDLVSRITYMKADRIICCSKVLQTEVNRLFPKYASKTRYLPNPYDVYRIRSLGQASVADYNFNSHTIISHGRLESIKDYTRLIRAFSIVKNTVDDAQLLILGDGSQKENLQRLTECLNVQDSVTLAGVRENPFSYLAKASLYVLSSLSEGFPNSLVEGMIFLPVVATDCKSGPREILSNGSLDVVVEDIEEAEYGILVKPVEISSDSPDVTSDDYILAKAIIMMLTDKDKAERYRTAAYKRANMYSVAAYKENLISVLENI